MNDAFTLSCLVKELKILEGGRIDKVNMPQKDEITLTIKNGKIYNLVISANPSLPRIYLSSIKTENPPTPYSFLMHLRKHLTSAIIERVYQLTQERVIAFSILAKNSLFFEEKFTLYAEIMGRYSNIVLVNSENKISECILHSSNFYSARTLLPGVEYKEPPKQENKRALTDKADFVETMNRWDGKVALHNYIISHYIGFAPLTIKQAIIKSGIEKEGNNEKWEKLFDTISSLSSFLSPCYVKANGKVVDYYAFDYEVDGEKVFTSSLCEAMDEYYRQTLVSSNISQNSNRLASIVKASKTRAEKKIFSLLEKIEQAKDNETDRKNGELITANIYKIKYGDSKVIVNDYYENLEREIDLNPTLSPAQNAQTYYKKYNKKKKTIEMSRLMIDKCNEQIDYYDSLLLSLSLSLSFNEIEDITKEMESNGLINKKSKKQVKYSSSPRKFIVDGYTVLIGKNNVQNDDLVKNSDGGFTWLHTQKIHGSHTIIQGKNLDISTIKKVAQYSAFYSKASMSDNVPVDYTLVKFVKKPSGALPGKVIYTNQQTVFVTPKNPELDK